MRYFLPLLISCLLSQPVLAESRYSGWTDPDNKTTGAATVAPSEETRKLIEELDKLIAEAVKARAANPVFLQDLKTLSSKYKRKYNTPRPRRVISEDFQDGNFTHAPVWTVIGGEYRIEKGWGLRSVAVAATAGQETRQQSSDNEDPAAALLGVLLQSALGGKSKTRNQTTDTAAKPAASVIHTATKIGNAFDLTLTLSSWKAAGQFSIGPYQGNRQQAGYRLAYTPGQPLELVRLTSRGASVIDTSARPVSLEDKKVHTLRWSRDNRGHMQILLDGQALIDTPDSSFRDPFSGIVIINNGTDVIVKTVILDDAG
jgi:hypothetical protein